MAVVGGGGVAGTPENDGGEGEGGRWIGVKEVKGVGVHRSPKDPGWRNAGESSPRPDADPGDLLQPFSVPPSVSSQPVPGPTHLNLVVTFQCRDRVSDRPYKWTSF